MFTKIGTVCIKQNENSRSVIIVNMNVLHMFPNVYDLSKEGNENWDILGDQNASVFYHHTESHQGFPVVSMGI